MNNNYQIKKDLRALLIDFQDSTKELSNKCGVSRRTLNNILSESNQPSYETLDKIYSFAYDSGYRFNKTKEELFKENTRNIVLFHGASHMIEEIKHNGSRETCDFGKGFYLGESYFQASSFVYDDPFSSVYVFSFDISDLNVVELYSDLDWMIIVCYFRKMLTKYNNHPIITNLINKIKDADVIIAPIADNKMFNIMRQFGEEEITSLEAIHSLSSSGLGKQYVLKTEKAISKLKEIERLFISTSERITIKSGLEERSKEIDTKLKLSKREFKGEGQFIDEIFK